jgi:hypothetical protein
VESQVDTNPTPAHTVQHLQQHTRELTQQSAQRPQTPRLFQGDTLHGHGCQCCTKLHTQNPATLCTAAPKPS